MVKKRVTKITIEGLARMVAKGFEETAKKSDMDRQFKVVNDRLDKFENVVLADHRRRIEKLEADVKDFKMLIGMK